jgi:YesN/AraC family two-component response regulator
VKIIWICKKHFSVFFKGMDNIIYAKDGEEGLRFYKKENPDIIVTDISMPKKDGIEMIKEIRKENKEIPIIITTSHDEERYFLDAIDLGVDKFLIKPLKKEKLFDALEKVIEIIEDKKLAEIYRAEQEVKKLRKNTKEVVSQFSEILINPVMIAQNNKIKYINQKFEDMFEPDDLMILLDNVKHFDSLIEKREGGFCASIDEFDEENFYKNKISVILPNKKRKIFQVVVKRVFFKNEEKESIVYVFEDITYLEYQKLKIQHYSEKLEDFIIKSECRPVIEKKEKIISDVKKKNEDKINAEEFVKTLEDDVIEEIDELKECEFNMQLDLDEFVKKPSYELLEKIIIYFRQYAKAIKILYEFDNISKFFYLVDDSLIDIELNQKNSEKIANFFQNLLTYLSEWRKNIFEDAKTDDIHYLDRKILNLCLKFIIELSKKEENFNFK